MEAQKQQDEVFALDERLVARVRQGSGAAFAALVARHRDAVYRIVRNLCATSRETEQALQQTFLSAYRDLASLQTDVRFRTWLYGIAVKTALAGRKRARPIPTDFVEPGRASARGEWPELAGAALARLKVTGVLREALESIDDDVRAAFVLCDLAGLPADEAAAILKTSIPTIRQRAHRARLVLRGFLDRLWIAAV
jgi:RNA polymerase sigma-70 factor (ECF subfamily)